MKKIILSLFLVMFTAIAFANDINSSSTIPKKTTVEPEAVGTFETSCGTTVVVEFELVPSQYEIEEVMEILENWFCE